MRDDSLQVIKLMRFSLLQLPFYFSGLVLVSLLASQGRHKVIACLGILNLISKLILGYILVIQFSLGLEGLLIATAMMYMISMFISSKFLIKF